MMCFSQELKEIREEKKVSKNELSQRSGVSRTAIRDIENGHSSPSLYILLLLTKSLDVKLWSLLKKLDKS